MQATTMQEDLSIASSSEDEKQKRLIQAALEAKRRGELTRSKDFEARLKRIKSKPDRDKLCNIM